MAALTAVLAGHSAAEGLDERHRQSRLELSAVENAIRLTEQRRNELGAEIAALEQDRAAINRNLIEASARARQIEARIDRSEERLAQLHDQQDAVRASLDRSRDLLGEVIAALQRMGSNPPPAILVSPGDALSSIRSAILLGAVVPELRAETEVLIAELGELARLGKEIGIEREKLGADLIRLAEEEERLVLLLAEKKKLTADRRQQLAGQSARAAELAAKADTLSKLIESFESEIAAAREAAEQARLAEEERRRKEADQLASARDEIDRQDFSDTARISPAMEFEATRGLLPRPVAGVEVRSFGQKDPYGDIAAGSYLATRVDARVVSPADGWVVYAGPFRSYGQLLILNVGSGYHVVLAGMDRIDVQLGQFVLAGEPVAMMGARRIASASAVDVESSRPVLYVEFRKDGKSIDPAPWWADATLKRDSNDS
ncbi:MAG: peptidase M23 [Alphaproteobacteria bacterium]|nr:MAG: peptidase M23 [Alphaproteobacteria bacterium]